MSSNQIQYKETRNITSDSILALYKANRWSAAKKPQQLYSALMASHSLLSAWDETQLVGLGNAISDGYLVVYYPHLLVLPQYQKQGIGSTLMKMLISKYPGFHQQVLIADSKAVEFYKECGFVRAGMTEPMWIYQGKD
jgi:GNAT superfamily N-acetyltransferase